MPYTIDEGIEELQAEAHDLMLVRKKYPTATLGHLPGVDTRVWTARKISPTGIAVLPDGDGVLFCPFEEIGNVRVYGDPSSWDAAGERFRMLKERHPEAWAFLTGAKS